MPAHRLSHLPGLLLLGALVISVAAVPPAGAEPSPIAAVAVQRDAGSPAVRPEPAPPPLPPPPAAGERSTVTPPPRVTLPKAAVDALAAKPAPRRAVLHRSAPKPAPKRTGAKTAPRRAAPKSVPKSVPRVVPKRTAPNAAPKTVPGAVRKAAPTRTHPGAAPPVVARPPSARPEVGPIKDDRPSQASEHPPGDRPGPDRDSPPRLHNDGRDAGR